MGVLGDARAVPEPGLFGSDRTFAVHRLDPVRRRGGQRVPLRPILRAPDPRGQNASMSRLELLTTTTETVYARLLTRLEGLTDEEFFWRPVSDCWTIYEDRPGHWTYHYAIPDPHPAPVTTIGWQLVHLGTCKVMYHEYAFGAGRLTWPQLDIPHTAAGAVHLLQEGQMLLRDDLQNLVESDLDQPRQTNWGDKWPAWRIFWAMTDHDSFHGGVIGHMRDIYFWSHTGSVPKTLG